MGGLAVLIMDQTPMTLAPDRYHYLLTGEGQFTTRFRGSARSLQGMVVGGSRLQGRWEPLGRGRWGIRG